MHNAISDVFIINCEQIKVSINKFIFNIQKTHGDFCEGRTLIFLEIINFDHRLS